MSHQPGCIGYVRISRYGQIADTQLTSLLHAGCGIDGIYFDIPGSSTVEQPALMQALTRLEPGDTLVIDRLDRISRDAQTLFNFQQQLKAMSVTLTVTSDTPETIGDDYDA